eukprot:g1922.t1
MAKCEDANNYSRFERIHDPDLECPLAEAIREKDEGNALYSKKDFEEAIKKYSSALAELPETSKLTSSKTKKEKKLLHAKILLNRAMVYLKVQKPEKAREDCSTVLGKRLIDLKPGETPSAEALELGVVKALFRRAQAMEKLGLCEQAFREYLVLLSVDSQNKSARKAYKRLRENIHERTRKTIKKSVDADIAKEKKRLADEAEEKEKEERKKKMEVHLANERKNRKKPPPPVMTSKGNAKPIERAHLTKSENQEMKDIKEAGYCYFKRQLSEQETQLIGDIKPKALSPNSAKKRNKGKGSEWNAEGTTWEETNVATWAKKCLIRNIEKIFDDSKETKIKGKSPTKVSCDASVAVIRNRKRYMFEVDFTIPFTVELAEGKKVKGKLVYVEIDNNALSEALESNEGLEVHQRKWTGSPSNANIKAVEPFVSSLELLIRKGVEKFFEEFQHSK